MPDRATSDPLEPLSAIVERLWNERGWPFDVLARARVHIP